MVLCPLLPGENSLITAACLCVLLLRGGGSRQAHTPTLVSTVRCDSSTGRCLRGFRSTFSSVTPMFGHLGERLYFVLHLRLCHFFRKPRRVFIDVNLWELPRTSVRRPFFWQRFVTYPFSRDSPLVLLMFFFVTIKSTTH